MIALTVLLISTVYLWIGVRIHRAIVNTAGGKEAYLDMVGKDRSWSEDYTKGYYRFELCFIAVSWPVLIISYVLQNGR